MKVFIPKPGENWVCDTIIGEFEKNTRHDIVYDIKKSDIVFLYAKWIANHFPIMQLCMKPVVTTVHHIVPTKARAVDYIALSQFTNVFHVSNEKTGSMLKNFVPNVHIKKLPYWVNSERWFPVEQPAKIPVNLHVGDRKLIASFQRDTEGASINSGVFLPKLEKGPDILARIVKEFTPKEMAVFLGGWRRDYLLKELDKDYIVSSMRIDETSMNAAYNVIRKYNGYYLVTSRYEGGPQAILEAARTKTKILSTDVGIASDILHPDCICSSEQDFVDKISNDAIEHTIEYNFNNVKKYEMTKVITMYDDLLDEVYLNARVR